MSLEALLAGLTTVKRSALVPLLVRSPEPLGAYSVDPFRPPHNPPSKPAFDSPRDAGESAQAAEPRLIASRPVIGLVICSQSVTELFLRTPLTFVFACPPFFSLFFLVLFFVSICFYTYILYGIFLS